MANEQFLARLTLRRLEPEDSFPERHIIDRIDAKNENEILPSDPRVLKGVPKRVRPPKAPSESPEGYDMRGRYWDAADILKLDLEESKKAPDVWDYVYDQVCLPPTGLTKTSSICRLGRMPIRRAWRRRSSKEKPDIKLANIVEAIMTYERGQVLDSEMRCDRCRDGKGASRECVVMPCISGSICSNCLYDGVAAGCNIRDKATRQSVDAQDQSVEESKPKTTTPNMPAPSMTKPSTEDYMIVLKLIEQMKQASAIGLKKDLSVSAKARRIEEAALQVAKAAREWGLKEGSS
ncbi:hypothetical protein HD806DRAFT_499822 [Xylariaceae sp. AK1471]|nr:hypothetical protein HD806DRAFT_499822 [Xylariaceae sp. AK1471]